MTDAIADPFAVTEEYDPFATADEAQSHAGPFIPWPKIDDVQGRLIVLVPRKYNEAAETPKILQEKYSMPATRQEWTTDLVVLDGGKLEYTYLAASKDGEDRKEATHVIDTLPALIPGWRVNWGNIIGTLNRIHEGPRPFALGRIKAGYTAKEMRGGKTFEQFAAELEAFYRSPKGKTQPVPRWHFVVSDAPEDRALGLAWWKQASADGYKVG